jgi:hypothetical protein
MSAIIYGKIGAILVRAYLCAGIQFTSHTMNYTNDFLTRSFAHMGIVLLLIFFIAEKTAAQKVGINTTTPTATLDVHGAIKTDSFQMPAGAQSGYFLQCDAGGNGFWRSSDSIRYKVLQRNSTQADTFGAADFYSTPLNISGANGSVRHNTFLSIHFHASNIGASSYYWFYLESPAGKQVKFTGFWVNHDCDFRSDLTNFEFVFPATEPTQTGASGFIDPITDEPGIGNLIGEPINGDWKIWGDWVNGLSYGGMVLHDWSITIIEDLNPFADDLGDHSATQNLALGDHYLGKDGDDDEGLHFEDNGDAVFSGNVGIGATTPTQARLVVNGSLGNTLSYGYLNSGGNVGTCANCAADYSIYANQRIAASEFNAFSDRRIKKNLRRSDASADLATLMRLQITDYQMVDSIAKGNKVYKKVIAQEVAEVLPSAVSKLTDVLPDIYQLAEIRADFVFLKKSGVKAGEQVRLIFGEKEVLTEVLAADANGFRVGLQEQGAVFVYGRQVSDFHTVDYEALTTLNISATQALVRQVEALRQQNENLQNENAGMKADIEALKSAVFGRQGGSR